MHAIGRLARRPSIHSLVTARERRRRALERGALHVVQHAAHAAHLLATAGASRPAVHQMRQRRAVPGRFLRAVAVDDHEPAVIRRGAEHDLARHVVVRGEQRADEAAAAQLARARSPRPPCAYGITVFTGPNASMSCGSRRAERIVAVAAAATGRTRPSPRRRRRPRSRRDRRRPARAPRAIASTLSPHLAAPGRARRAAPCARPRPPGRRSSTPASRFESASIDVLDHRLGNDRAADRGALLPRLHRHLAHDFLDEEIELLACPARRRGRACEKLSESASMLKRTDSLDDRAGALELAARSPPSR